MQIDTPLITQLGILGFLGYYFISQFFTYLKSKKNGNGNGVKEQLQVIGENHLSHILEAVREQTKEMQNNHNKQIEVLYQIKASLDNLKNK